jgi:glucose/arabinose dehydrogenase
MESALLALALLGCVAARAGAEPPEVGQIVEPLAGAAPLNPADVHMVAEFADGDGGEHVCSDWEIWAIAPSEAVWEAPCAKGAEKVHVHLGDGEFVNSLQGHDALGFAAEYELRVRFLDSGEEWSEWAVRGFKTIARGGGGRDDTETPWMARPGYAVEGFATGFQLPVNIAMVPEPGPHPSDPLLYVAELYGSIKVVSRDGTVRDYATGLLNFDPTGVFPGSGEQGLAGLAVDPVSGDLFASLVYEDESSPLEPRPHYPKVVRLYSDEGGLSATGMATVLDMAGEVEGPSHQVSHLTIAPNGDLYVHNGDGYDSFAVARDLEAFRGKILRMTLGGDPLPGNPFYDASDGLTARDYVWAYGFRNPFGGAIRLSDDSYYEVENGPATDRLARVLPGVDYLWEGSDATMAFGASYTWSPPHAPVNIEFVEPERFGGSGFPASGMGHAFVTESGATYASGPQATGKRVVEFDLGLDGVSEEGPVTLVEYTGTGKATAVGLAAGPDGLYFTDLYKDKGATTPIDPGANVLRIRYCGEACMPEPPAGSEPAVADDVDREHPEVSNFRLLSKRIEVRRRNGAGPFAPVNGTSFLYTLSEWAKVRIRIERIAGGFAGQLLAPGRRGSNRRAFAGRLGGRVLPPGGYRATIDAVDAAGNASASPAVGFKVVAGGRGQ